jgi:hypothetical protein
VTVADRTLDALAANPNWLLEKTDGALRGVLESVLEVLRKHGDERLSSAIGAEVLRSAVAAVALRREFLEATDGAPIVAGVVRTVLGAFLDPKLKPAAAWQLARSEVVAAAVKVAFDRLGRGKVDAGVVGALEGAVGSVVQRVTAGEAWDPAMLAELIPVGVAVAAAKVKKKTGKTK